MLTLMPFLKTVLVSLVYSLLGMAVFAVGFLLIRLVSPFSIRKEIEEDQNVALAIVIGCVLLGLSIIIAAAIHG
jgi:putative membrane protein